MTLHSVAALVWNLTVRTGLLRHSRPFNLGRSLDRELVVEFLSGLRGLVLFLILLGQSEGRRPCQLFQVIDSVIFTA